MKVILQKNILGLGDLGETKKVSDGYARNFLLPRKLVLSAHAGTARAQNHIKRSIEVKTTKRKKAMAGLASKLQELGQITIETNVGEEGKLYGSVTNLHVAEHLHKLGFEIDRRKIEIKESIRSVGKYNVRFHLTDGIVHNMEILVAPNAESIKKEEERQAKLPKEKEQLKEEKKTRVAKSKKTDETASNEEDVEKASTEKKTSVKKSKGKATDE